MRPLLPRERVLRALDFAAPEVVPLECHPSPAGLYEHGKTLLDLWRHHPHDFGDFRNLPIPQPEPEFVLPDGSYHAVRRNAWGVEWEEHVFGQMGHPRHRPLDDWAALPSWSPPPVPASSGPGFEAARAAAATHRERYFLKAGWGSLFEILHQVRRFEDVLVDLALDTREIHRLADAIVDHQTEVARHLVARGCDALQLGDDFGTQQGLILSVDTWRRFFRPRYQRLLEPVLAAGVKVFFHSCGQVWDLLPDLADLGVSAIWPQVSVYDLRALAQRCRALRLAVALHPDRGQVMTRGTPAAVAAHVEALVEAFEPQAGGSWFYLEIDHGFPRANLVALFEAVARYR